MRLIPRRYSHYAFGVIQSGLTTAVASAIASWPFVDAGGFFSHWSMAWAIAWLVMLPVVILAAPAIRWLVESVTRDE